jgi:TonB-dependent SusC/RagA subfamily outer membrane receptor
MVSIGYGQQSAGNIVGAVSTVGTDQFNTGRIISPQALITGKVAGVQVVDNNEPGGGLSIRIRGATSVNASSEPLYVVDGMPLSNNLSAGRDPLNFLNPNDIETMTVLKDASAAAIYGANAANGVVIITTKKAGKHGPTIEYDGNLSSSAYPDPPLSTRPNSGRRSAVPPGNQRATPAPTGSGDRSVRLRPATRIVVSGRGRQLTGSRPATSNRKHHQTSSTQRFPWA